LNFQVAGYAQPKRKCRSLVKGRDIQNQNKATGRELSLTQNLDQVAIHGNSPSETVSVVLVVSRATVGYRAMLVE
jgi:hypothetical protein